MFEDCRPNIDRRAEEGAKSRRVWEENAFLPSLTPRNVGDDKDVGAREDEWVQMLLNSRSLRVLRAFFQGNKDNSTELQHNFKNIMMICNESEEKSELNNMEQIPIQGSKRVPHDWSTGFLLFYNALVGNGYTVTPNLIISQV